MKANLFVVVNVDGKDYVPYPCFIDLKSKYEHDVEERNVENEALRKQIEDLDRQNTDIQNSHMKLYNDSKDEIRSLKERISELESELEQEKNCYFKMDDKFLWMKPNEAKYIYENNELKAEIQRLREKCGEATEDSDKALVSDNAPDYEKLCRELQDQHQQDCILINNLNVTIDKLVDRYANLRKNVGMD